LLQNLIGNALKFQDGVKPPRIEIGVRAVGDAWQFSVRDNGIGIDRKFNDRIFSIFQRLHRKEEYPGTGIGLSTCRKLVRLCGGDIQFESELGIGTNFIFTIPSNNKEAA
jgi:two-component system, sensor histidine kinase and response regulator